MNWNQDALRTFRYKLAVLFPAERDARALLEDAQVNPAYVDLSGSPVARWYEALSEARKRFGALDRVLDVALDRYPDDDFLRELRQGTLRMTAPPAVRDWLGGAPQLEKILGTQSTLVPVSFLEQGLERAKAVGRIRVVTGASTGYGTGFLIREDLLLTNNHVIRSAAEARDAMVDFDYQRTLDGHLAPMTTLRLNPDLAFATSTDLDWTVVGVEGQPGTTFGVVPLRDVSLAKDEVVQIIQHPAGGEKQLTYRTNIVAYVDRQIVQYLTDTMPGSSGSPVFNRNWQVVALHHASSEYRGLGALGGRFECNQGIHINAVLDDLRERFIWP